MPSNENHRPDYVKGALAGLVAGIVASAAMDVFQVATARLLPESDEDPATVKAADAVLEATTGGHVPDDAKAATGNAVHYATGAALGLLYGIAAEYRPEVTSGRGLAFAGVTAALLDEGAVPLLGLGAPPTQTPPLVHAYSIASHGVFGTVAEFTRALVRRL